MIAELRSIIENQLAPEVSRTSHQSWGSYTYSWLWLCTADDSPETT